MRFVLLTSKSDSVYADTAMTYEYPARYRRFFEPLINNEPMIAIIYEPLSGGRGRMSYIGWAALRSPPVASGRRTEGGQPLWEVRYVDRLQEFPNPVPRDYLGEPVENWLRELPMEHRSVRTSGASVRWLEEDEGRLILELGHAGQLGVIEGYSADVQRGEVLVAERTRRLVEAVTRDARFRRDVMTAYEFRCAVTGLHVGTIPEGRATRLLDAAHIRPVGARGPDAISNGISLTPTVHRLFDEGLISAKWRGERLELVRSPLLERGMIESTRHGTYIRLDTGAALSLPLDPSHWPSVEQVRYHQREVFKGPESVLA
ncbi:MAG: HNH endonuclease [Chloroflexi bacterium]|nr:HNH endonuclease [Chloroflexota bacterium]